MTGLSPELLTELKNRERQVQVDLDVLAHDWQQLSSDMQQFIGVAAGMGGDVVKPDYFDWPVGTPAERAQHNRLPGAWIDATGYAQAYKNNGKIEYHTGIDFNLNAPKFDADAHSPVYAAAVGVVVFAGVLPVWGNVITILHGWHSPLMWTRYAHVENMIVKAGDAVQRGVVQICNIGNAGGTSPYHLHYDMASVDLGKKPGDWPSADQARVLRNYLSPLKFMQAQGV